MNISAVLRELMAAGLQGEALIAAVERIEDAGDQEKRQTRAARNKRYQQRLKSRRAAEADSEAGEPEDKTLKTSKTSQPSYEGSPKTKVSPDPSKNPTPLPPGDSAPTSAKKGHRLPENFRVSPAGRTFARDAGWTEAEIDEAEAEFVDHWTSVPGAAALKLDWAKTWRNRVRRFGPPGRRPSASAARSAGTGRDSAATALLRRDRMEREADGRFDPFDDPSARGRPDTGDRRSRDPPPERGAVGGSGPILDLEPIRSDRGAEAGTDPTRR